MTASKSGSLALFVLAGIFATACVTSATDEEIGKMCDNLVKLRGDVDASSVAEKSAEVKERYQREEKRLKDWKARDLKAWDEELEAKLKATEDEEEQAKLKEEYGKKKAITESKHDPGIAELPKKLEAALAKAKAEVDENQKAWKAAVDECAAKAKKEGVSQKVAQCRIAAESTDKYWNSCR